MLSIRLKLTASRKSSRIISFIGSCSVRTGKCIEKIYRRKRKNSQNVEKYTKR
jgi:hypothetical protein